MQSILELRGFEDMSIATCKKAGPWLSQLPDIDTSLVDMILDDRPGQTLLHPVKNKWMF